MTRICEFPPLELKEPPCPDVTLALAVDFELRWSAQDNGINLTQPADGIMRQFIKEAVNLKANATTVLLGNERRRQN